MSDVGDSTPATQASMEAMFDKLVKMVGDLGKRMDGEISSVRQEASLISASVKNVQTQLLDKQGRFDTHDASSSGPPSVPGHKLRFPKYDGSDDPITWLHKGEQFFRAYGTPEHLKVPTASFYLDGAAAQWYYRLEKNQGVPSWTNFVDGINRRFGPPLRSNPLGELTQLRRTSTVDDYQEQFLVLLARCADVTEPQQIAIFTAGLQQPLSTDVELQKPATLEDAMALARAFERRQQVSTELAATGSRAPSRASQRPLAASSRSTSTPSATMASSATAPPKAPSPTDGRFKRLSPDEMAQRRLEGLCFNCPEKFSREHAKVCSGKGIYYLELGDDDASDDGTTEDDITISVNAVTGIRTSSTLQLRATIGGNVMIALIDSGSTHSFISDTSAHRVGLKPVPRPGLSVAVANGDRVPTTGVCQGAHMDIAGEPFSIDLYTIPLVGYDLILGCDWLRTLGPVVWDLDKLSMTFWHHDHKVQWTGITIVPSPRLTAIQGTNPLQALLAEFDDLFATPVGLPPPRALDHLIYLLPNTLPIAVRPYRYAIEAQC